MQVYFSRLFLCVMLLTLTVGAYAQSPAVFQNCSSYSLDGEAQTAAVGDINGDGRDDVAVTTWWPAGLFVLYQHKDGTLGEPRSFSAPNSPLGLVIADLNADGLKDLAVGGDGRIFIYYQQTDGALDLPVACSAQGIVNGIAAADLNSDGLVDLAVSSTGYAAAFVYFQDPDNGIVSFTKCQLSGGNGRCISVLDYNSDGLKDLALLLDGKIAYLQQKSEGGFAEPQYFDTPWAHSLASGDITGDGCEDLVYTVDSSKPDAAVGVFSYGSAVPVKYSAQSYAQALALLDADKDGKKDVLAAHRGYESLTLFRQNKTGTLDPWERYPLPYCNSYQPGAIATGDLNSDGEPEVVVADYQNGLNIFLHVKPQDNVPPTCSVEVSGKKGRAGWFVSPVAVKLIAEDNPGGTGVKGIDYTFDGSNWHMYSNALSVPLDGVIGVGYFAEDLAGNKSQTEQVELKLDMQAPALSLNTAVTSLWPANGKTVQVPVEVTGLDTTSGLAGMHLKVVDEYGSVQPEMDVTTGQVVVPLVAARNNTDTDGRTYTIILTATDVAGNTSSSSVEVTVPKDKPKKVK